MKRLAGTTLADSLGLPLQKLLRAFVDVGLAIELAHARGVVHRDLKPANIVLGDYGEVYVLDWGVARVLGDRDATTAAGIESLPGDGEVTQAGSLLGTPGYMAPEQLRGPDVGPPADVYALGAILFEILTRERLHPGHRDASADTSPARRCPGANVPPELDAACVAALALDPAARPSARALASRIEAYLDGDRDLEQRRKLSAEQLARARAALAAGDRAAAIEAAGRAFVFDQRATAAAELLTKLIVEPPEHVPAEVEREVDREQRELDRRRSRRSVFAYLSFFLVLPTLFGLELASAGDLVAVIALVLASAVSSFISWRVRQMPTSVFLGLHLATATAFSRFVSPFVLSPMLIVGMLLALADLPGVRRHPWIAWVWVPVAGALPFVLERAGVLAPTWHLDAQGALVSSGVVFAHHDPVALVLANLALLFVVAAFAMGLSRDRRDAQRKLFVQAWHLRHLLPRTIER